MAPLRWVEQNGEHVTTTAHGLMAFVGKPDELATTPSECWYVYVQSVPATHPEWQLFTADLHDYPDVYEGEGGPECRTADEAKRKAELLMAFIEAQPDEPYEIDPRWLSELTDSEVKQYALWQSQHGSQ